MVAAKSLSGDLTRFVVIEGSHIESSGDGDVLRGPRVPVRNNI